MVPFLGHGIGLRTKHFPDLLEQGRRADWFEVITENFLIVGGRPRAVHAVGKIGRTDPGEAGPPGCDRRPRGEDRTGDAEHVVVTLQHLVPEPAARVVDLPHAVLEAG